MEGCLPCKTQFELADTTEISTESLALANRTADFPKLHRLRCLTHQTGYTTL